MITRVNISFFRYHSKETGTGEAPLYCRLWHENKRKIFSIGFKVTRNKWNQNKQMATGKSEMAQRINTQMEVIKNKLVEIETRLIIEGSEDIVEDLYALYIGKTTVSRSFITLFEERYMLQRRSGEGIHQRIISCSRHPHEQGQFQVHFWIGRLPSLCQEAETCHHQ